MRVSSPARSVDPCTGVERRHHVNEASVQHTMREAAKLAQMHKPAGPHVVHHCFATRLLQAGYDIRTVQERPGTRMCGPRLIYAHVLNRGGRAVVSLLDA